MFFSKKVDMRSKSAMREFLLGHFRYPTMNVWNRAMSYANCVKVNRLGLTSAQLDTAFDLITVEDYWLELSWLIDAFTDETNGAYTIGSNGRSSGYLVLYRGEFYNPGYKSRCRACGQLNFEAVVNGSSGQCGRCHKTERFNLFKPLRWHRTLSQGVDDDMCHEEFMDLSLSALKEKVDLVCRFDEVCDQIRDHFIDLLDSSRVVEEVVMVPKTVRHIASIHA